MASRLRHTCAPGGELHTGRECVEDHSPLFLPDVLTQESPLPGPRRASNEWRAGSAILALRVASFTRGASVLKTTRHLLPDDRGTKSTPSPAFDVQRKNGEQAPPYSCSVWRPSLRAPRLHLDLPTFRAIKSVSLIEATIVLCHHPSRFARSGEDRENRSQLRCGIGSRSPTRPESNDRRGNSQSDASGEGVEKGGPLTRPANPESEHPSANPHSVAFPTRAAATFIANMKSGRCRKNAGHRDSPPTDTSAALD